MSKDKKAKFSKTIIVALVVSLISVYTFKDSLYLSLFGDDWLAFWLYKNNLGRYPFSIQNHIKHFLTVYGSQDILLGLMQKIIGYRSEYYYLLNLILRISASFSIYKLSMYLAGKNKLASFASMLFFSTTFIGIEVTNWVFNMTVFIGIIFTNFALYLYFISRKDPNKYLFSMFLLFLAVVTVPHRLSTLPVIYLVLDVYWYLTKKPKLQQIVKRQFMVFLTILIILNIGSSFGKKGASNNFVNQNIQKINQNISNNDYKFLTNPLLTTGSLLVPEKILTVTEKTFLNYKVVGLLFITVIMILMKNSDKNDKTHLIVSVLIIYLPYLCLQFLFVDSFFLSSHRYLAISAGGVALFWSYLINKYNKSLLKHVVLFIFFATICVNIFSVRKYLKHQVEIRGKDTSDTIWSQLTESLPDIRDSESTYIIYFEGEPTNGSTLHDVITFGLPPHLKLLYNMDENDNVPVGIENLEALKEYVSTGKGLSAFSLDEKPFPVENIYAYKLTGKTEITDITERTRLKLETDIGYQNIK